MTERGTGGSRSALLYKVLALVLVSCFVAYLVTMSMQGTSLPAGDTRADGVVTGGGPGTGIVASSGAPPVPDHLPTARPVQSHDPDDLANYVLPGEPAPRMEEVIDSLHKAGIHSGLGAFSPPGTSPPLVGLAVPDDYPLPEGYVRHGQATDDGQRIEPILMFSPDFEFFDSAGVRIEVPLDRVVPPHLAPPGLPLRRIEIPAPRQPGSSPV